MEVQILWAILVHLAQSVERQTFNLVVVGSSPTEGIFFVPVAQLVERLL